MAKIYTRTTSTHGNDKLLILDGREALMYPFNVGTWNEARLGMFVSLTSSVSDDANAVAETITTDSPSNMISIGIKDSSDTLPRIDGSMFWGLGSANTSLTLTSAASNGQNTATGGAGLAVVSYGTSVTTSSSGASPLYLSNVNSANTSTFSVNFIGVKFVIANRGTSTQSVSVSYSTVNTNYSTITIAQLRSLMNSATFSSGTTAVSSQAWHDSGTPRAIPDTIFVRLPHSLNRLRIHTLVMERYS